MDTLENNKLIAEFMGIKPIMQSPDRYYWRDQPYFYCAESTPEKVMQGVWEYVKYSTSWDWLMPVVAKISQLPNAYEIEEFLLIRDELCTGRIETVYEQVVGFIKWYNQNK